MPLPTIKAKPWPKKRIIPRLARRCHEGVFVVGKEPHSKHEQELVIHFGHKVPYRVVKLSTRPLPRVFPGKKPVTWLNNFGVVDRHGKYVDGVTYTVLLPALPKDYGYVTYIDGQLKVLELCGDSTNAQIVQAELSVGDPPVGSKPKEDDGTLL